MPLSPTHNLYDILKDFSGVFITALAALGASVWTIVFQRRQLTISANNLKLALFEKRYAKLADAERLVKMIATNDYSKLDHEAIRALYVSLEEGRFLLSKSTVDFLKKLHDACEGYLTAAGDREMLSTYGSQEEWRGTAKETAAKLQQVKLLRAAIPSEFERDLRIQAS